MEYEGLAVVCTPNRTSCGQILRREHSLWHRELSLSQVGVFFGIARF